MNLASMLYGPEDLLKALGIKIDNLQREIERLKIINTELKSKHYKDKELARMRDEYYKMQKDLHRGFPITEEENDKIQEFKQAHPGEYFEYKFIPTPLGVSGKIVASNGDDDTLEFQEIG